MSWNFQVQLTFFTFSHFLKALKIYFINQLLIMSNRVLHEYDTFYKSWLWISHLRDFCICVFYQFFSLVWSRQGSVGKMWCYVLLCTSQALRLLYLLILSPLSIKSDQTTHTQSWWGRLAEFISVKLIIGCFFPNLKFDCRLFSNYYLML